MITTPFLAAAAEVVKGESESVALRRKDAFMLSTLAAHTTLTPRPLLLIDGNGAFEVISEKIIRGMKIKEGLLRSEGGVK